MKPHIVRVLGSFRNHSRGVSEDVRKEEPRIQQRKLKTVVEAQSSDREGRDGFVFYPFEI